MKIFVNYANQKFKRQQEFAIKTAKLFGGFDKCIAYDPKDLSRDFVAKNKNILDIPEGAGLWVWKPYVIVKTLEKYADGDYIFYSDSGFFITGNINKLIEPLEKSGQDIMVFQTYYPEEQWTKKELFENMNCQNSEYKKTNQCMATICLIKNSDFSRNFFSEWLSLAEDMKNISDAEAGSDQADNFIEHRHDQSIFSLLCKKHKLITFRAPFVFGEKGAAYAVMKKTEQVYGKRMTFNFVDFENSDYPTMLQVNKEFKFLGIRTNLFFVSYLYLALLNVLPFGSWVYEKILNIGIGSQKIKN